MANTLTREYATCSRTSSVPGNTTTETVSQQYTKVSILKSDKVNGQVVAVQGGQFRKATGLVKSRFAIIPQGPQDTVALNLVNGKYVPSFVRTTPGGGRLDFVSSNMSIRSSDGSLTKCLASEITHRSGMENEAATKALLKIADQKVNLSENLATLGMTLRLLGNPVKNLVDLLSKAWRDKGLRPYLHTSPRALLRSLEKGPGFKLHKDIADRYLEYVYGWEPLVKDTYTLIELAKDQSKNPLLLSAKGSSTRDYYIRPQSFGDTSASYDTHVLDGQDNVTTRCCLWAQILPTHSGLRSLNQLGLVNPFQLVWELTPFSFVIDWLLPIGSVLHALSAPAGLQFINGTMSSRQRVDVRYQQESRRFSTTRKAHVPASGSFRKDSYTRTVLSTWPVPGLWIDPDPFRGDRTFKALALAISNLKGKRNF